MELFAGVLRAHPEIALFITLALGFWFGSLKFGKFSLGAVTSTLIAGLLVGQLHIPVPELVQSVFFLMFLFAVGYSVGPQFFAALKSDGLPQVAFALIVCACGFATAWIAAKLMGYGPGLAAGLLAGGYTNSGTLGVATSNMSQLGLDAQQTAAMAGLAAIAYAVTYPFGTAGAAYFLGTLAPKLLGVDLPKVSKELEAKMATHGSGPATDEAYQLVTARAYRLENAALVGRTPRELNALVDGAAITRYRSGGHIVEADTKTVIPQGATLAIAGSPLALMSVREKVGPEVDDRELLEYASEALDIVLTRKNLVGHTVREL